MSTEREAIEAAMVLKEWCIDHFCDACIFKQWDDGFIDCRFQDVLPCFWPVPATGKQEEERESDHL